MSGRYKPYGKPMALMLTFLLLFTSLSILSPIPIKAAGTTYYFSTSGNDSNDGLSQSMPKQSLAAAANLMIPGNTILLKRGDEWYSPTTQWAVANKAGTSADPITVDAYGSGNKPVVACMEKMTSGWTNLGSNKWSHSLNGYTDALSCFVNGLRKVKVSGGASAVDADYKFSVASSTIYIYSTTTPTNIEVINSNTSLSAVRISNCSYTTFKNICFKGGGNWFAINVQDQSSHLIIDSCDIREVMYYGIFFDNSTTNYSWYHESPIVKNCYLNMGWVSQMKGTGTWGGDGINFRSAVRNGLVQGNTVVDFQHTGIAAELCGSSYVGVNNNTFELNEVYLTDMANGYMHGFDVQGIEGKCTGNIFRRNYFHDLTNSGHLLGNANYVYSNIFNHIVRNSYNINIQAYAVDAMPFSYNGMQFITKGNYCVNNTMYNCDMGAISMQGGYTYQNFWKNNLIMTWTSGYYGFENWGTTETQIVENNDLWNGSATANVIHQGNSYYTAAAANNSFSNYNNNIQSNPLFVNAGSSDFNLQSGSPCISAGQVLTGIPGFVDYYGNAWNASAPSMGAIQYGGTTPAPGGIPTSGLQMWLKFDETSGTTASDSSGSGNNGTLTNGPTWATDGKYGGCVSLDGSNDWVNIPDQTYTGDFSIGAWVNLPATINNADAIVGQEGSGQDINFYSTYCRLYSTSDRITATTALPANTWTHYVITRTSGTLSMYINGSLNTTAGTSWTESFIPKAVGRGNAGYLQGKLDDLAIYNRALNSTEVTQLYNHSYSDGEMLSNPGFESGTASWRNPWGGTLNSITSPVHSGSKAVSITGRTGNYQGATQDIKSILLANGQGNYNISGWGRLASGSDSARVTISITDGAGSHWHFSNQATFNSTSYTQASGTVNITWTGTLNTAYITVETISSTTDLYVDDVSMIKS